MMYGRETNADFIPSKGFRLLSLTTSVSISRTVAAVQSQQARQPNGSFAHYLAMLTPHCLYTSGGDRLKLTS